MGRPDPYHVCISAANFEAQMRFLRNAGYQSISLEDAAQMSVRGEKPQSKQVVITFDDGYKDFYTHAFPILKKYELKADVMLVSGRIGGSNVWDQDKLEAVQLLNLEELKEMGEHGISYGSHSMTHRRLTDLEPSEAYQEIFNSKTSLEELLGREIRTFCFPYGRSSPEVRKMVKQAGYVAACGIEQREHTLFNLSRVDAAGCRGSGVMWRLKLSGRIHQGRRNPVLRGLKRLVP